MENIFEDIENELIKSGLFTRYPKYIDTWTTYKLKRIQIEEQEKAKKTVYSVPEVDIKTKQKKDLLNRLYFELDKLKEIYQETEKQGHGNITEKQRLQVKKQLLSQSTRIFKAEQKIEQLENELNIV